MKTVRRTAKKSEPRKKKARQSNRQAQAGRGVKQPSQPVPAKRRPALKSPPARELRFIQAFHASPIPVSLTVMETGRYLEVNEAYLRELGYLREEVIGHTSLELNLWAEPAQRARMVETLRKQGTLHTKEFKFRTKSGAPIDVLMSVEVMDWGGEQAILSFFHDITASKQAEKRFASLLDATPDAMVVVDLDGRIVLINAQAENTFGYRRKELLGQTVETLIPEHFRAIHPRHRSRFASHPATRPMGAGLVLMGRRKDGSEFPVDISLSPLETDEGLRIIAAVRDITERKRMENELRDSEAELRALFSVMTDVIIVLDENGQYVEIAPTNPSLLYKPPQELIGKTLHQVFPTTQADAFLACIRRVLKSGAVEHIEYSLNIGESEIWFSAAVSQASENKVMWVARDVTEHKRAEKALRDSDLRTRLATEAAEVGIWEWNVITNKIHWDTQMFRLYGITPTVNGIIEYGDWSGSVLLQDLQKQEEILQETVRRQGNSAREFRIRRRNDGMERILQSVETVRLDAAGQTEWVVGTNRDITEIKQAEKIIVQQIAELQIIHRIGRELGGLMTPEALAENAIASIERNLGYSYGAVLLLDESSGALVPFAVSDQGGGKEAAENEKIMIASHGIRLGKGIVGWVAEHGVSFRSGNVQNDPRYYGLRKNIQSELCVPIRFADRVIGVINFETTQPDAFSETDQRILETVAGQIAVMLQNARLYEQVQQHAADLEKRIIERTAELEEKNRELEAFSYSISHDLRAPLRGISGFAGIVARRYRDSLNEEGRHYVDNIVLASERMGQLIDDLLTYSRLGRSAISLRTVSLQEVFALILKDLEGRIREAGADAAIAADLPSVRGDPTLLLQIFTNLIANALTYHRTDVPPRVRVDAIPEGAQVIVRVSDNGIGIQPEFHEKIFDVFQRLHSADEYPGTGIGLAIVKKSANLLNGRVWVESTPREGSTFFIELQRSEDGR